MALRDFFPSWLILPALCVGCGLLVLFAMPVWAQRSRPEPAVRAVLQVGHSWPVMAVASGWWSSEGGRVEVLDAASGRSVRTLNGTGRGTTAVAYSVDGRTLASGSSDGTILLWDPDSGTVRDHLLGHQNAVTCLTFS